MDDFVELARTRLVSTAVCAEHRTPLDVAGPRPVVDEAMATALGAEGNSNSRLLKVPSPPPSLPIFWFLGGSAACSQLKGAPEALPRS